MILSDHMHPKPSFTLFCKQIQFRDDTTGFQVRHLLLAYLWHNQQPGEASGKDPQSHITKIWCLKVKVKKDTDF